MKDRLAAALADRYTIERELGQGGMASVYLAHDIKHDRKVAIKVLREDLAASLGADRFLREIRVAARLQHPHIVGLLDSGDANGLLYYVMPYVDGESLRERLVRSGPLPVDDALRLTRDVADALAYAHARGVVHRDIKPENIMVSGRHAMVMDFGVARALSAATGQHQLTTMGMTLGTPAYMAPEQVAADPAADERVDLYALGLVAYEMLVGSGPYAGTTPQQMMAAHVTQEPANVATRRPEVAGPFGKLVMQCLAKSPADRPASADAIVTELDAVRTAPATSDRTVATTGLYPARLRWWVAGLCAVAALVFIAIAVTRRKGTPATAAAAPAAAQTIAVLPLRNEGGDSAQEFFADGMTDEIAEILHRVPGLVVRSHGSSFAFKGRGNVPEQEIGKQLQVTRLVEGSVRRHGDALQLDVQLVNAGDGSIIDSWKFPARVADVYAVQDTIAQRIVDRLRLTLTGASVAATRAGRTTNPAAHDAYLQGRFAFAQVTEASLRRSIDYYRQAIALDSTYADPWAAIAVTYYWLADEFMPPKDAFSLARDAAIQALARDSTLAIAHASLGVAILTVDLNYPAGLAEIRRGLQLDSNSVDVLQTATVGTCLIKPDQAGIAVAKRAVVLDPLSPVQSWNLGYCYYISRHYAEAIAQDARTQALDPRFFYWSSFSGEAYRELGNYPASVAAFEAAAHLAHAPLAGLAVTYARMGRRAEALQIAGAIEDTMKHRYLPPEWVAEIFANLGETDSALVWLQHGIDARSSYVALLNSWPVLDPIRHDPRFQALVKRVGLP